MWTQRGGSPPNSASTPRSSSFNFRAPCKFPRCRYWPTRPKSPPKSTYTLSNQAISQMWQLCPLMIFSSKNWAFWRSIRMKGRSTRHESLNQWPSIKKSFCWNWSFMRITAIASTYIIKSDSSLLIVLVRPPKHRRRRNHNNLIEHCPLWTIQTPGDKFSKKVLCNNLLKLNSRDSLRRRRKEGFRNWCFTIQIPSCSCTSWRWKRLRLSRLRIMKRPSG